MCRNSVSAIRRKKGVIVKKGFTIVELLIVIVVIGILAAISIVAYNGIQERARMSKMKSEFHSIEQAVELYKVDEGKIPECDQPNPGYGCTFESMLDVLPLKDLSGPTQYVGTNSPDRWAVRFTKSDGSKCKAGRNMHTGWFSSAPSCW